MIDFAKLSRRTDEERAADREDTDRRLKAARQAELRAKIKHTRTLTTPPTDDVQCRFDDFGSRHVVFTATDENGRSTRCHRLFDEDDRDAADRFMNDLGQKPLKFVARGYFRPTTSQSTSKTTFTFIILEIEMIYL